jgi:hypothetical protein
MMTSPSLIPDWGRASGWLSIIIPVTGLVLSASLDTGRPVRGEKSPASVVAVPVDCVPPACVVAVFPLAVVVEAVLAAAAVVRVVMALAPVLVVLSEAQEEAEKSRPQTMSTETPTIGQVAKRCSRIRR